MKQQLYVRKRSGERVAFDSAKIIKAINSANQDISIEAEKIDSAIIQSISDEVKAYASTIDRDLSVEEIQDRVENALMKSGKYAVARAYITYRYQHNEDRKKKKSDLDKKIQIKTQPSYPFNVITWRVNGAAIILTSIYFQKIYEKLMIMVLSISMMPTTLHSTCTIAT